MTRTLIPSCLALAFIAPLALSAANAQSAAPLATNSLPAEPLTTEVARQALAHLHIPTPGPGMWCRTETGGYATNITYEWRLPDGRLLTRREDIRSWPENPDGLRRTVTLEDGKESWTLFEGVALGPKTMAGTNSIIKPEHKALIAAMVPLKKAIEMELEDPKLTSLMIVRGDRRRDEGRVRLHVFEEYGDQARKRLGELLEPTLKELKKQVPFYLRPLVTTSALLSAFTQNKIVRESVIDETSGVLVCRLLRDADGTLGNEETAWQICTNLGPDAYSVPEGMKRIPASVNVSVNSENEEDGMEDHSEDRSITVKKDDVVLIEVPGGPAAIIQITNIDTKSSKRSGDTESKAFYRWRSRVSATNALERGTGFVRSGHTVVKGTNGVERTVPKPGNETTIRAGAIWVSWSFDTAEAGKVSYLPQRAKVKRLARDAFETSPQPLR